MTRRRENRQVEADALEVALEFADGGNPREGKLVHIAGLLHGATPIREAQRARTKEHMLRSFQQAQASRTTAATQGAGSRDGAADSSVHTTHVQLPTGEHVHLADVERIDRERATDIARALAALDHEVRGAE